jgi:hypothetical protein
VAEVRALLLVACGLLAMGASAAEVYRWVDKDGKVHFSDSPPPGVSAEKLAIKSQPTDPAAVDLAETTREVRENRAEADAIVAQNSAKEAAAKAEAKAEACAAARKRYDDIQYSRKFASKDAEGKEVWLSGADADNLKQKAKADVEAKCAD